MDRWEIVKQVAGGDAAGPVAGTGVMRSTMAMTMARTRVRMMETSRGMDRAPPLAAEARRVAT